MGWLQNLFGHDPAEEHSNAMRANYAHDWNARHGDAWSKHSRNEPDDDRFQWGSEGGGGWYQGDRRRVRGEVEENDTHHDRRSFDRSNDAPSFEQLPHRTAFDPTYDVAQLFTPRFGGQGYAPPDASAVMPYTGEIERAHTLGDRIYGRSVIKPDRPRKQVTPESYRRSDARVREDVSERLMEDPEVDASEIEIEVTDGVVTLDGRVDSRAARERAEEVCESVRGVREVIGRLRVARATR